MRKDKYILLLFILLAYFKIIAQTEYQPQGIGGGGAMSSFSMSPYDTDLWFVATDMGTVFRSTNQGKSWDPVDHMQLTYSSNLYLSSPLGFSADPNVILFANNGNTAYRSTNKGLTWSVIIINLNENEKIKYWLGNSENANIIFCATDERLLKSIDKGVSFQACNFSGPSIGTFIDYTQGILYHADTSGIYTSDDMGKTFTLYHTPNVMPLLGFAGGRDNNGLTLAYIDGNGENAVGTWIQPYIGLVDGANQANYDNSTATSGFVWIKRTGESNFQRVSHHQTYARIDAESNYLYGGGGTKLEGGIWNIPRNQYQQGSIYMAENNSRVIYVTGNIYWPRMYGNKTWVSTDGGVSFEKKFQCNDWDNGYIPWPADKLEHSAVGLEVGWWDGSWDNFNINRRDASKAGGTGYFFLHVTKSTGENWLSPFTEFADTDPRETGKRWRSTGLEVTSVQALEFNPYNTDLLYVGMADIGGYMSEDGGNSIRMCDNGLNSNYDYAFDPDNTDVVYVASSSFHDFPLMWFYYILEGNGGIFRSDNRGRTWARLTPDNDEYNRSFLSVAYDPDRNILYGGSHSLGVARSLDGGTNWEYMNTGIPQGNGRIIPQIELDNNGNVYVLLTGDYANWDDVTNQPYTGIYFLDVEGGATEWELLRETVHPPNENYTEDQLWRYPTRIAIDPSNPNVLWLIDLEKGGLWLGSGIWKSTDRGENWHRMQQYTHPTHIMLDSNNTGLVYVTGIGHINGTWGNGGLMYSTDGGETWNNNLRVPYKSNGHIATLDPNTNEIWYGFHGAGLLHGPRPETLQNTQKPSTPENFEAAIFESDKVILTWEPSTSDSEIEGYRVSRSGNPSLITEDTFLIYPYVTQGAWNGFYLVAFDQENDFSDVTVDVIYIDEITYNPDTVIAPLNLVANIISSNHVNLTWSDNNNYEDGFKLERLINGVDYEYKEIAQLLANSWSYVDSSLQDNFECFYRIRAYVDIIHSDYSNIAYANSSIPIDETIWFYPNPARDIIYLKSDDYKEISIFKINGVKQAIKPENLSIDISSLSKGTYVIVKYTTEGKRKTSLFIKQ